MHAAVKRPCLDDREVLVYVEGWTLPMAGWAPPDLDAVRAHLDACTRCCDLIAAVFEARKMLG